MMANVSEDFSSKLEIKHLFPRQGPVSGINNIYITLSEAVEQGDIGVGFFEVVDNEIVWEAYAVNEVLYNVYNKPYILAVPCPRYRSLEIDEPINISIFLLRRSDEATAMAESFKFVPVISGVEIVDYMPKECCANGGRLLFMACNEIISPNDFQVDFIEVINGKIVWIELAKVIRYTASNDHAPMICIKCPSYKSLDIDVPVEAYILCRRLSDGAISKPVMFHYIPLKPKGPLSLMRLCRRAIRQSIGTDQVEERIDSLKLPESVKMYLLQRT